MTPSRPTPFRGRIRTGFQTTGQALAELAIVLPLLLTLAFGVTDFARAYSCLQSVESAAKAGAQYGSLSLGNARDTGGILQQATNQLADVANLTPQITTSYSNQVVTVTVSCTFNTVVKWPFLPNQVPLSRTVVMRLMQRIEPPIDLGDPAT